MGITLSLFEGKSAPKDFKGQFMTLITGLVFGTLFEKKVLWNDLFQFITIYSHFIYRLTKEN